MKTKHHHIILSAPVIQSGDKTLNNPIRCRWFALALGGFLFTSIFALSVSPVEAQCQQWNVGHGWRFRQGTINVDLDLHQNGTVITGTATHDISKNSSSNVMGHFGGTTTVTGDVDGTVKGDQADLVMVYSGGNIYAMFVHTNKGSTAVLKELEDSFHTA